MDDLEVARYALRTFGRSEPLSLYDDTCNELFGPVAIATGCDEWRDGTCAARCHKGAFPFDPLGREAHEAPAENCRCGIYGCLSLEHLIFQYPVECKDIIAVIAVEGQTYLGTKGLRTQYARVVAWWSPGFGAVAERQFKDAKRFPNLFEMARSYGLDLHLEEMPCSRHAYHQYAYHFEQNGFPREFVALFDTSLTFRKEGVRPPW